MNGRLASNLDGIGTKQALKLLARFEMGLSKLGMTNEGIRGAIDELERRILKWAEGFLARAQPVTIRGAQYSYLAGASSDFWAASSPRLLRLLRKPGGRWGVYFGPFSPGF